MAMGLLVEVIAQRASRKMQDVIGELSLEDRIYLSNVLRVAFLEEEGIELLPLREVIRASVTFRIEGCSLKAYKGKE